MNTRADEPRPRASHRCEDGPQANHDQVWNDVVLILRSREIAVCPSRLPTAGLTPKEVLTQWVTGEAGQSADIARCDAMRREGVAAADTGEKQAALRIADLLDAECRKTDPLYPRLASDLRGWVAGVSAAPVANTALGSADAILASERGQASLPAAGSSATVRLRRAGVDGSAARLLQQSVTDAAVSNDPLSLPSG